MPERVAMSSVERSCQTCPAYSGEEVDVTNLQTWCLVDRLVTGGRIGEELALGEKVGEREVRCSPMIQLKEVSGVGAQ